MADIDNINVTVTITKESRASITSAVNALNNAAENLKQVFEKIKCEKGKNES